MLKLWHNKCREAKPAFTKNTGASRFKQKCCKQGVKLSSVQCSFILGCTWSCVSGTRRPMRNFSWNLAQRQEAFYKYFKSFYF